MPNERRPVTVLFADLVGFSTLAEYMDPEELRTLITETFAQLTLEVTRREGSVEKFIGDAIMAIFGVPKAHEDDPERAVETALRMVELVRAQSADATKPIDLRVGINSGLVVAGRVGDGSQAGVMGDAVNVAARLQQAAGPGEVIAAASVWQRVRGRFDGESVGAIDVKGRERPVDSYRIVGSRLSSLRRQAPFVGRRDELALLELLWSSALKGNTHVVSLVGEPGVGKSRLLSEFTLAEDAVEVRINCDSQRAFGPFLDAIEGVLGGLPANLEGLEQRAVSIGLEQETAMLVGAFLGLAGAPPAVLMADEQRRRQVFGGVWQLLVSASHGRPSLMVLDDVHRADRSSLDLLGFLLERLSGAPFMLVLAHRPGFDAVEKAGLRASHTAIHLEPLDPADSVELAKGFLSVTTLPPDLEQVVASRAEGNAFFVEELLQALLELGSLTVVDGSAKLAAADIDVPATVQGTILARVDRLEPRQRTLLQQAAVIGRNFSTELIQEVTEADDASGSLRELARAQLVVAQGPDQWAFKHGLIQEVVYEMLLLRQRKDLHRKVAQALEARAGDDPAVLELLAEHYAKADVRDKARRYALAAGDLAAERMGFVQAVSRYESALRLWGEGDQPGRLALMMKLGHAARLAGEATIARTALLEAESGWRALGNSKQAGAALVALGITYWGAGDNERAGESLQKAIQLLEPAGQTPELIEALVGATRLSMMTCRYQETVDRALQGLRLEQGMGLVAARSHLLNNLGVSRMMVGDFTGLDNLHEALELAHEAGDVEAIGRSYSNLSYVLIALSQYQEALAMCRAARDEMRRHGAAAFEGHAAGYESRILVETGHYQEAEALSRETLATFSPLIGGLNAGLWICPALIRRGRYDEARQLLDELVPAARRIAGNYWLVAGLAYEAELEEARGNLAAARRALVEAVDKVVADGDVLNGLVALVPAVRLLEPGVAKGLVDIAARAPEHPAFKARLLEADGVRSGDRALFQQAADTYRSLEIPYDEARCHIESGDLDRASEIVASLGIEDGPLGVRLRAVKGANKG